MILPMYLAQTSREMAAFPMENCCFLGCHFSPSGEGLDNLPTALPAGSVLILDDRVSPAHHSPAVAASALQSVIAEFQVSRILLDFEHPPTDAVTQVVNALVRQLPCPVILPEAYASGIRCPVFLSAPHPHETLEEKISPWKDREIWLEAALSQEKLTLTPDGCEAAPCKSVPGGSSFLCEKLHCNYQVDVGENAAVFWLWRDAERLDSLLKEAQHLGVQAAVGLFQELKPYIQKASD